MNNLTKREALQALTEGKLITHVSFDPDEFEDFVTCTSDEFWHYRDEDKWLCGWGIYEISKETRERLDALISQKSTNPDNVRAAIMTMERVIENNSKFDMALWQGGKTVKLESEAHHCGTVCCFGGWVALSESFHQWGGTSGLYGQPRYADFRKIDTPSSTIADYLGVSNDYASALTCTSSLQMERYLYQVRRCEITPELIISKLKNLL
jgi:hypothetical protein